MYYLDDEVLPEEPAPKFLLEPELELPLPFEPLVPEPEPVDPDEPELELPPFEPLELDELPPFEPLELEPLDPELPDELPELPELEPLELPLELPPLLPPPPPRRFSRSMAPGMIAAASASRSSREIRSVRGTASDDTMGERRRRALATRDVFMLM